MKPNEYLRKNKLGLTIKDFESDCAYCGKHIVPKIRRKVEFCSNRCWQANYWNESQGNEGIACKICGRKYKKVVSHAYNSHGLTKREYKEEFGLDVKRGILLPEDREYLGKLVKENGTVDNLKNGARYRFKPGHTINYTRSPQTIARLKKQWEWARKLSPANKPGGWRSGKKPVRVRQRQSD